MNPPGGWDYTGTGGPRGCTRLRKDPTGKARAEKSDICSRSLGKAKETQEKEAGKIPKELENGKEMEC